MGGKSLRPKCFNRAAIAKARADAKANYFTASHFWLATVQEVLQADWQEDWQLPQPPLAAVDLRFALLIVVMCFKRNTSFLYNVVCFREIPYAYIIV